jgi:hypothetical protein
MDILIEHFWYGKTGKPESKIINDEEAKLPSSFLMHKIAEKMKDKIMTFMDGLHAFLESYALTSQQEGSKFFVKAVIGNPDPDGEIIVAGNDVIVPGDKMLWWIDSKSYTLSRASISTTFEGEQVEFSASYKYISPGLNYIAFAEILVPGKSITVQLHAYDYNKMD